MMVEVVAVEVPAAQVPPTVLEAAVERELDGALEGRTVGEEVRHDHLVDGVRQVVQKIGPRPASSGAKVDDAPTPGPLHGVFEALGDGPIDAE